MNAGLRLSCPECASELGIEEHGCACPGCGAAWPIEDGVPRFSQAREYWGEIPREDELALIRDAQQRTWRQAVVDRFPEGEMAASIQDLRRAAWLPLLGLGPEAVALDIGSGHGAITHALALSLGEVYSVEAVPERIAFTQTRLRQEGLQNVHLIQATALALPFPRESFDLIVVNGILEWVGEWDLEGGPREAQLRFLRRLTALLKPDGVVMIGIENRIGYNIFRGEQDHSGLPYTSLLPRWAATLALRMNSSGHYRTVLNAKRQYRTYTYTARGYRRLLRHSGLPEAELFWADPGYNLPYTLIPLPARRQIKEWRLEGVQERVSRSLRVRGRRLRELAARAPLIRWFLPDFVIFARQRKSESDRLGAWLAESLQQPGRAGLSSHVSTINSGKQVLRICAPNPAGEVAIVKVRVRGKVSGQTASTELANRELIAAALRSPEPPFRVPELRGSLALGATRYELETTARGASLARRSWRRGYLDSPRQTADFTLAFRAAVAAAKLFQAISGARPVDPSWYDVPGELAGLTLPLGIGRAPGQGWVQHGDWTVENVFVDQGGGIEVIDWESLGDGYPPLYDIFSLIASTGYLTPEARRQQYKDRGEFGLASFISLFFSDHDGLPRAAGEHLAAACAELSVETTRIPQLLAAFLTVRVNYYRAIGSHEASQLHRRLLEYTAKHPDAMVFGRFPMRATMSAAGLSGGVPDLV
ncbi:MAG: methyltransferase domain-containing protein [Terriglobales bacterium]